MPFSDFDEIEGKCNLPLWLVVDVDFFWGCISKTGIRGDVMLSIRIASVVLQRRCTSISARSPTSLMGALGSCKGADHRSTLAAPQTPIAVVKRPASTFFSRSHKAEALWKTSTSVSSQGRQRGRAKGLVRRKNLNRGKLVGVGPAMIMWPGFTQRITPGEKDNWTNKKMSERQYKQYEDRIAEIQSSTTGRRAKVTSTPLQRGWTSASPRGKKFAPPLEPNSAINYDGFECVLLDMKQVSHMTGNFGRLRTFSTIMLTGNKKGIAGFTLTKTPTNRGPAMFQQAANRAGLRLMQIDLYEGRTVYHDFWTQFSHTRIFVKQKPIGHGVVAHRVIKSACELIGIKDLEAVVEGSHNPNSMIKAFFLGLLRQKTHQTLADDKGLHLLELRGENDFFPKVVASPSNGQVRTKSDILPNETLDFETICYDGNLPHIKPEFQKGDISQMSEEQRARLPGWQIRIRKIRAINHRYEQRIQMLADYGRLHSHLTDMFPECVPFDYTGMNKSASSGGEEEEE